MNYVANESLPKSFWFFGAVIATAIGILTALSLGAWWFIEVKGHCGVVRFYEQAAGVILIGGWLTGTAVGLAIAFIASRRNAKPVVIVGSLITILATASLIGVTAMVVREYLAANLTLESNPQLVAMLRNGDLDARKLAAHKLGERRALEAIPVLIDLLEDPRQDINVRHNAAIALGKICAAPQLPGTGADRAVAALTNTLKDRDVYLPSSIADALGIIGDVQAVEPLAQFINDSSRSRYSREDAVRALGEIGGKTAQVALKNARATCGDDVRACIDRELTLMGDQSRP